jgi:hypothetical protein
MVNRQSRGETIMSRVEQIGDCTLMLGDCREILPTLGKVDAVVTDDGLTKLSRRMTGERE